MLITRQQFPIFISGFFLLVQLRIKPALDKLLDLVIIKLSNGDIRKPLKAAVIGRNPARGNKMVAVIAINKILNTFNHRIHIMAGHLIQAVQQNQQITRFQKLLRQGSRSGKPTNLKLLSNNRFQTNILLF